MLTENRGFALLLPGGNRSKPLANPRRQQIRVAWRGVPPEEGLARFPLNCQVVGRARDDNRRVIAISRKRQSFADSGETRPHGRIPVTLAIDEENGNLDLLPQR